VQGTPQDNEQHSKQSKELSAEGNSLLPAGSRRLEPVGPEEWELEEAFDLTALAWEVVNSPPFKDTKDEFGHSYTAAARVPMSIMRRITRLKEAKGMNYDINSDVIRDAIFCGLPFLEVRWKSSETAKTRRRIEASITAAQDIEELTEHVTSLSRSLKAFMDIDEMKTAVQKLTSVVNTAIGEPDNWDKVIYLKLIARSPPCKIVLKHCTKYIRDAVEMYSQQQALEE